MLTSLTAVTSSAARAGPKPAAPAFMRDLAAYGYQFGSGEGELRDAGPWQAAVAWVVVYALRPEISKYQSTCVLEGEAPGPKSSGASRPRLFPNSTRPIPSNVVNGEDEVREPGTLEGIVRKVALVIVATASSAWIGRFTRASDSTDDRSSRSTVPEYD